MTRVLSLHAYRLAPGIGAAELEAAFARGKEEGLFELPGLMEAHLLRGIRGARRDQLAALWLYESLEAWEALWGPVGAPVGPAQYPAKWHRWERELLAPLLDRDPDKVTLTSYEELDRWIG